MTFEPPNAIFNVIIHKRLYLKITNIIIVLGISNVETLVGAIDLNINVCCSIYGHNAVSATSAPKAQEESSSKLRRRLGRILFLECFVTRPTLCQVGRDGLFAD